ncbi:ABC transporter ATP-binding protein [Calycomorphotria hydatis]|uniref:Trehalose import ATP-binding protein SugC n=1 Tax=Calycomorphotria hydatis TaxID=2528027 RepID=A0A517T9M9_9PLAN|nr:ATP-binding cassette domain-containing protein [Calycomorphotria hydatis]QDT65077.1 Trehalose import ATP-binding protein SugC [Calycomorphotria hydatis]
MVSIEGLIVDLGEKQLGPIDLIIDPGSHVLLRGPSGSGKTSLLESIAGLRDVREGRISLGGFDVTHRRPADRHLGYAPQDAVLFESMTVEQNLEFPLKFRGIQKADRKERVHRIVELLHIDELLHRKPYRLSGGERQRIALGRAVIYETDLLLLDEPFSALDEESREVMRAALSDIRQQTNCTILHASHDMQDVDSLADRVVNLHQGRILTSEASTSDGHSSNP